MSSSLNELNWLKQMLIVILIIIIIIVTFTSLSGYSRVYFGLVSL